MRIAATLVFILASARASIIPGGNVAPIPESYGYSAPLGSFTSSKSSSSTNSSSSENALVSNAISNAASLTSSDLSSILSSLDSFGGMDDISSGLHSASSLGADGTVNSASSMAENKTTKSQVSTSKSNAASSAMSSAANGSSASTGNSSADGQYTLHNIVQSVPVVQNVAVQRQIAIPQPQPVQIVAQTVTSVSMQTVTATQVVSSPPSVLVVKQPPAPSVVVEKHVLISSAQAAKTKSDDWEEKTQEPEIKAVKRVQEPAVEERRTEMNLPAPIPAPAVCLVNAKGLTLVSARRVRLPQRVCKQIVRSVASAGSTAGSVVLGRTEKQESCSSSAVSLAGMRWTRTATEDTYLALMLAGGAAYITALDATALRERSVECVYGGGALPRILSAGITEDAQMLSDDAGNMHVLAWSEGRQSATLHRVGGAWETVTLQLPAEVSAGGDAKPWSPLVVGGSLLLLRVFEDGRLASVRCVIASGECTVPVYSRGAASGGAPNSESYLSLSGGTPFVRFRDTKRYAMLGWTDSKSPADGAVHLGRPVLTVVEVRETDAQGMPRVRLLSHASAPVDDRDAPIGALWQPQSSPSGADSRIYTDQSGSAVDGTGRRLASRRLVPTAIARWDDASEGTGGLSGAQDAVEVVYAPGARGGVHADALILKIHGLASLVERAGNSE